jgi:RNA polymerase sigma-70 factor (ECF subfamily)
MPRPGRGLARLTAIEPAFLDRLFAESGARSWPLSREQFASALQHSGSKHFGAAHASPEELKQYWGSLHLEDFALAVACAEGCPHAWEHFVAVYRGYLRASAGVILQCAAASPAACELADSLFADLYGLQDGKRSERSLFRYFHGRSSLKTWLRAVLAQRHVDGIRSSRRFCELQDQEDGSSQSHYSTPASSRAQTPADPHRQRYISLFTRTLEVALGLLAPEDKERLRLYYAELQTLAEIGRTLGEHESSVSRSLERIRRQLRHDVEQALRKGSGVSNGPLAEPGLSEAEISICFEYAAETRSEGAPIDFDKLFPRAGEQKQKVQGPKT